MPPAIPHLSEEMVLLVLSFGNKTEKQRNSRKETSYNKITDKKSFSLSIFHNNFIDWI